MQDQINAMSPEEWATSIKRVAARVVTSAKRLNRPVPPDMLQIDETPLEELIKRRKSTVAHREVAQAKTFPTRLSAASDALDDLLAGKTTPTAPAKLKSRLLSDIVGEPGDIGHYSWVHLLSKVQIGDVQRHRRRNQTYVLLLDESDHPTIESPAPVSAQAVKHAIAKWFREPSRTQN